MNFLIILPTILAVSCAADQPNFTTQLKDLVIPVGSVDDFVFKGNALSSPSFRRPQLKIANGRQASDGQFPFTAEMSINLKSGGLLCTGSLISSNWILSARHCIADTNAQSVLASLGSADRQSRSMVKIYSDRFVWLNAADGHHPDIALFRLARNAPNNNLVRPVALPRRARANFGFEGYLGTAVGFGGTGGGRIPRYLQYTQFRILTRAQCFLGDTLQCSRPPSGSSSLQGGDSGGPLVAHVDGVQTLIGVNVVVVTAGSEVWQGSTRVSSFLDFIHDSTGIPYR